jgi:hypothetical protein
MVAQAIAVRDLGDESYGAKRRGGAEHFSGNAFANS